MLAHRLPLALGLLACSLALAPAPATAADPEGLVDPGVDPDRDEKAASDAGDGLAHALTFAARAGNPGYGGLFGYRLRLRHGIGVGLEFEAGYAPEAFIGGYATERNTIVHGRLPLFFPVHRSRRLTLALTLAPGIRSSQSADPGPAESSGLAVTVDVGVFAYLRAHERVTLLLGVDNPVSIEVDPIVGIDKFGTLLVFGPVVPMSDRASWYATVEAGGVYGSDGDAGKFLMRGTTGVRVTLGAGARRWRAF